ncbi:gamma-glutamyltransferase [Chloroflexota bacterium]
MHSGRTVSVAGMGMVAAPHHLASAAGLRVLQEGGNAVDAAVATSATLHVTVPQQCSPGGDSFWLIYVAAKDRLYALNASGRAPQGLSIALFQELGLDHVPLHGGLPVTVPGSIDGWCTALARFGSQPLGMLLQPAIDYAEQGVEVGSALADAVRENAESLRHLEGWRRVYLPGGAVPEVGSRLRQADLGATLRAVAGGGREALYRGRVAGRIARSVQREGGVLTTDDLAAHRSDWVSPLSVTYRGHTVYQMPPNSRGAIALMALNLLETWDLGALDYDSPQAVHLMVQAYRLARGAFNRAAGDPQFVPVPVEQMLSGEAAAELREQMHDQKVAPLREPAREVTADTVYVAVVDGDGNAVSLIDSTYYTFGSGVVAEGTGLILQNRGAYFSLDSEHPNCLEPGKRPIHTLMPAMVFKDGRPWLVFGSMGGDGQAQTQLQILHRIVDLGMDVQQAIEAPRWVLGGTLVGENTDSLRLESRFPGETRKALVDLGHEVVSLGPWSDRVGVAQAILIDRDREMVQGGADPRGEGLALGW